jgi:3-oxoacyl-[acyl-carrier protein] reductase
MGVDLSLGGRHALVCGGSRGIGRAAAGALAGLGARVTLLARSEERLREALVGLGPDAAYVVADADDRASLGQAVDRLLAERGAVHVLVNNAGGPPGGPLVEATEAALLAAFGRHVLASHGLVQKVLPGMKAAGWGRIVNIVSTSVYEPIPGLGVSNVVRAAMGGWAKTLSDELPPGVTINNVLPGYTATDRLAELRVAMAAKGGTTPEAIEQGWRAATPEGRLAEPAEIAAVIAFLCSPASSFVRGVSMAVDGGRTRSI